MNWLLTVLSAILLGYSFIAMFIVAVIVALVRVVVTLIMSPTLIQNVLRKRK